MKSRINTYPSMKKIFFSLLLIAISSISKAQSYEWNVDNIGASPGERIVAVIDAGTIDQYDGIELIGQVIDNNGNWGYNLPTVANFKMFLKFSGGLSYKIIQDVKTNNITLRLRKISDSKFHLTANCPNLHTGMRVLFKEVEGYVSVAMGDPIVNDGSGELVISEPVYESFSSSVSIVQNAGATTALTIKSSTSETLEMFRSSESSYYTAGVLTRRSRGSLSTPTAVLKDDVIGGIYSAGHNGSAYSANVAVVRALAADNFTSTSNPTYLVLETTPANAISRIERVRINENGNVGIGTNSPDTKLAVNGTIHTKEVKVDLLSPMVPDYVFANDYKLKTLPEVEKYIKENSHLPEIASAREFEKNGVLLAEMNMKLLKKVEELTLYAIEQEKKTEKLTMELIEQNKIVMEQNKRIEKLEKQ